MVVFVVNSLQLVIPNKQKLQIHYDSAMSNFGIPPVELQQTHYQQGAY